MVTCRTNVLELLICQTSAPNGAQAQTHLGLGCTGVLLLLDRLTSENSLVRIISFRAAGP